jgi:hypothetical protein
LDSKLIKPKKNHFTLKDLKFEAKKAKVEATGRYFHRSVPKGKKEKHQQTGNR